MGSTLLVDSNKKLYCPIHLDNKITHHTDNMIRKEYNGGIKEPAKTIKVITFDEKAKTIDKYALIMMPILFIVTSIFYWTTHLRKGYVIYEPRSNVISSYYTDIDNGLHTTSIHINASFEF